MIQLNKRFIHLNVLTLALVILTSSCGKSGFRVLFRIPREINWQCKIDEILTSVYFCICKNVNNLTFLNLERSRGGPTCLQIKVVRLFIYLFLTLLLYSSSMAICMKMCSREAVLTMHSANSCCLFMASSRKNSSLRRVPCLQGC